MTATASLTDLRVLYVEDIRLTRMMTLRLLQELGIDAVRSEADGVTALSVLKQQGSSFDLLILDIGLPGLGGIEIAEAVRRGDTDARTDVPVMFLTSGVDDKSIDRTNRVRRSNYIEKPVSLGRLRAQIEAAVALDP